MKVNKILLVVIAFLACCNFHLSADDYIQKKVETVIVPQKTVQFDSEYFRGTDYYYQLGEKFVQEKNQSRDDEVKELKAKLELLLKLIESGALKGNNGGLKPEPQPEEVPEKPSVNSRIITLWNKKCVNCHGSVPQNNGLSLVKSNELVDLSLSDRAKTYDRVYGYKLQERGLAKMPKGGNLTDDEVLLVYEWLLEKVYE